MGNPEAFDAASRLMRDKEACKELVRTLAEYRGYKSTGLYYEQILGALCVVVTELLDKQD